MTSNPRITNSNDDHCRSTPISSTSQAEADLETPFCCRCTYNLTGILSGRCPECGWEIDWELARQDEEQRRIGTPVHRVRGWRAIPATFSTVGLMLFRPVAFARRLRHDESLWPAAGLAIAACLSVVGMQMIYENASLKDIEWIAIFGSGIIACLLVNGVIFMAIGIVRRPAFNFWQRFRLFLLLSLYSTCFVGAWPFLRGPPFLETFDNASFLWPLDNFLANLSKTGSDLEYLGRTVMFYWWAMVLCTFAFVRTQPRWRASGFLAAPVLSAFVAVQAGALTYGLF